MPPASRRKVHFVLSTHWDREWRESFQELRYDMVRLMDRVIDGLETGQMKGPFQTDGQSVVITDYLDIHPGKREQVSRLAAEGKLLIGPWYTMPDEFTVSGESLIRNLRVGRQVARSFGGKTSDAGYVPDMFGHTSQLPQILAGFSIRAACIWRGVNNVDTRNFIWRGADGSEIVAHKFGRIGYGTYAHAVRHGHIPTETEYNKADFVKRLDDYLIQEARATEVDPILLLDSCDHQEWDEEAYALVFEHLMRDDSPYELIHTSLDAYLAEMVTQKDRITARLNGELREPGFATQKPGQDFLATDQQWMIPGVLSSRVWMKQANRECETVLCQWAEPFSTMAQRVLGAPSAQGFLDAAWRILLENHAHDSIDGCSVDQVHRDMSYRFDQARLIANRVARESMQQLAANVEGNVGDDELRVAVYNPSPRPFSGITELTLQIPSHWPAFNEFFGFEPKPAFRLYGPEGGEIPYQRLGQSMNRVKTRVRTNKFLEEYVTNDIGVALHLQVPALGYTTVTVRAAQPGEVTRYPALRKIATSAHSLENEHLVVTVERDGMLSVNDKRTGRTYHDLLRYEDRADIGDGWYHGIAANDMIYDSIAANPSVGLSEQGAMQATLCIRTTMRLPVAFDFLNMRRSEHLGDLVIDTTVTLRADQDFIDVVTKIDNNTDDHWLRVLLPSGATSAQTYLADSAFDVVERPITLRTDNHLYRELEVETKPQQSWTAVYDDQHGLAVVADGLFETAIDDSPSRPIALTLFRSTRRTALTNGEPDGQLHRKMTFRYRIVPLAQSPDRTHLCELGQGLSAGLRNTQLRGQDIAIFRSRPAKQPLAVLPASACFLQLEGKGVLSSLCASGDGIIEVRLFNPTEDVISGVLLPGSLLAGTWHPEQTRNVNFEGVETAVPVQIEDGKVVYNLRPKQIITLRLQ